MSARAHPRWGAVKDRHRRRASTGAVDADELAERLQRLQTAEFDARTDDAPRSSTPLGPNFDVSTQTLLNDYSQHHIDTGLSSLPGSWVHHTLDVQRCAEYVLANSYPQLERLRDAKEAVTAQCATPATYLKTDLRASLPGHPKGSHITISELIPIKFDTIIIDPPLATYAWEQDASPGTCWTWDDVAALPIQRLAAKESFVFLWVGPGSSDGLEKGREVLAKWGYRRCEDIVWVRTGDGSVRADPSPLCPSVQHCLMGIRGTVVRSSDSYFVHCNVDTDVILWEGETVPGTSIVSPVRKPHQLYRIAENFCLGSRRVELFGTNRNLRPGWLTIGLDVGPDRPEWNADAAAYVRDEYNAHFGVDPPSCPLHLRSNLVPYTPEIEFLRPKTPQAERRARLLKQAQDDSYDASSEREPNQDSPADTGAVQMFTAYPMYPAAYPAAYPAYPAAYPAAYPIAYPAYPAAYMGDAQAAMATGGVASDSHGTGAAPVYGSPYAYVNPYAAYMDPSSVYGSAFYANQAYGQTYGQAYGSQPYMNPSAYTNTNPAYGNPAYGNPSTTYTNPTITSAAPQHTPAPSKGTSAPTKHKSAAQHTPASAHATSAAYMAQAYGAPYAGAIYPWPQTYTQPAPSSARPDRSALLGQGAGGPTTVSVHSGSDVLSGAQAIVVERTQREQRM
ncbi:mRNA (2'-O-methyladenosine-N(6)-)-methyltransferase [Malassezia cuniculi]|uniref:mRNA (2'-O-methyladenosine-N(6)-)-methyltransferase n=1 Tax=Malassezia cuniculi TaxID=948313 RepID=A0AAF0JBQ5_9BASI|nr:mRNA (2'-O-methyladenosine-N(6)-)-methyltransferase [Malassezia cuniculi]